MTPRPWTIKEIRTAVSGDLLQGRDDMEFAGIGIDSRKIGREEIFVAVRGPRFDGHDFITPVLQAGVKGVIVAKGQRGKFPLGRADFSDAACVAVNDTVAALGDLARYRRNAYPVKVVAITGSNGKTTTKEMTASVLAQRFKVLRTQGNLNNEIGLPLTLFALGPDHEWAVLELGMNHPGEILRLAGICLPDAGIITNVGPSHLEGVGSIAAVARAKGELLKKIMDGGTAVLNADDPQVAGLAEHADPRILFFGEAPTAQIRAEDIEDRGDATSFTLVTPDARTTIHLKLPGVFMVSNALAAAAAGHLAGLSAADIKKGLESAPQVKGRMNIHHTQSGISVIDDTYNANPRSVRAAISALKSLGRGGRSAMVFGDMMELGDAAPDLHVEIGKMAHEAGVDRLFLTGEFAGDVAKGALTAGMPAAGVCSGTKEKLLADLNRWTKAGDWVLVKGSRSMHMETIVNRLLASEAAMAEENRDP